MIVVSLVFPHFTFVLPASVSLIITLLSTSLRNYSLYFFPKPIHLSTPLCLSNLALSALYILCYHLYFPWLQISFYTVDPELLWT